MEWAAFMHRAVFWADNIPIKCTAAKQARFLPFGMFSPAKRTGPADNFSPVCNDLADNTTGTLCNDEMVSVEERNNCVRCLFDTDDMIGINVHPLFVHAGQKYHVVTSKMKISL
jgi:hypothetical protein